MTTMHRFARSARAWSASLLVLLLSPAPALAHPHVFVEHRMTVLFDDHAAPDVRLSWTFDEMYSSMLRTDYVKSRGDKLSATEVQTIRKRAFENLANYHYFIMLQINGKPIAVTDVKDFDVHFAGEKAVYEFTLPLKIDPVPGENAFEIAIFDPEYYVEFTLAPTGGLTVSNEAKADGSCEIVGDTKIAEIYGNIDSDTVRCRFIARR